MSTLDSIKNTPHVPTSVPHSESKGANGTAFISQHHETTELLNKISHAARYILASLVDFSCFTCKQLTLSAWTILYPKKQLSFDQRKLAHSKQVEQVINDFKQLIAERQQVTLKEKSNGHLWRPRTGKSLKLNLHPLDKVLHIDPVCKIAHVQGTTTMFELVKETLAYGYLPKVVPELGGITVGGAISGLAVESSSFKYGLFHRSVKEMEVLTGEGIVRRCTRENENKDLFFGMPNSYGTLGYVLSAKVELIPAKPYVHIEHLHFDNAQAYFQALEKLCLQKDHDYIDGALFSDNKMVITLGSFVDQAPYTNNYRPEKIYYKSIQELNTDYLTTSDYIWRWDTDSFWTTKDTFLQSMWFRKIFGQAVLRSDRLERVGKVLKNFHTHVIEPFEDPSKKKVKETLIQDVGIPIERGEEFYKWFKDEIGIFPIFICPLSNPDANERFPLWDFQYNDLAFDFGFFSSKVTPYDPKEGHYNRMVEKKLNEINGKKSLYSQSFFDRKTFEKLYYGKGAYLQLKRKYDPEDHFPKLFEKCVKNH